MKAAILKFSLAALVAAATLGHAARAATLSVTSLADSGPGTLRQQIASAASGDTINFKVTGTIVLTSGQLVVSKNLNIVGPPPFLFWINLVGVSGNSSSRVFRIDPTATVAISYLNVAHGHSLSGDPYGADGGGILNLGRLHLFGCSVHDNDTFSGASGGGIANRGTLLAEHCRITHNSITFAFGGGIANSGDLKLDTCAIWDNAADEGGGGLAQRKSLLPSGVPTKLEIVNCNFQDNDAEFSGAGVYIDGSAGSIDPQPFLISKTTLANNSGSLGGAIYAFGHDVLVKNCTLSGNLASDEGGGIRVTATPTVRTHVTLNNVTITGNSTDNSQGAGGAGLGAGVSVKSPFGVLDTLRVANSIIAGNFNVQNSATANDCRGVVFSLGHNLIQDTSGCVITGIPAGNIYHQDPKLDGLAYNGGPTLTHALIQGSPAIDAGNDANSEPSDQRGVARPAGAHSDIGAYEGSIPVLLRLVRVDMLYNPAPYIIVCDPAGPFPPWQGSILGSRTFDVRTINTTTLRLQSRTAAPRSTTFRDVNGDGILDLELSFDLNQALQGQDCEAVTQLDLVGTTLGGQGLIGHVQIEAVAR